MATSGAWAGAGADTSRAVEFGNRAFPRKCALSLQVARAERHALQCHQCGASCAPRSSLLQRSSCVAARCCHARQSFARGINPARLAGPTTHHHHARVAASRIHPYSISLSARCASVAESIFAIDLHGSKLRSAVCHNLPVVTVAPHVPLRTVRCWGHFTLKGHCDHEDRAHGAGLSEDSPKTHASIT